MNMDHYINWTMAKGQLIDVFKEVREAIRLCDVAICATDPDSVPENNTQMSDFFKMIETTDEQHREMVTLYLKKIGGIKLTVSSLAQGEVNHGIE